MVRPGKGGWLAQGHKSLRQSADWSCCLIFFPVSMSWVLASELLPGDWITGPGLIFQQWLNVSLLGSVVLALSRGCQHFNPKVPRDRLPTYTHWLTLILSTALSRVSPIIIIATLPDEKPKAPKVHGTFPRPHSWQVAEWDLSSGLCDTQAHEALDHSIVVQYGRVGRTIVLVLDSSPQ